MTNSPSRHGGFQCLADAHDRQTPTDRHDGPAGDALRRHERESAKPTRTSNPTRETITDPPERTNDPRDYRPVNRRGSNERPEQGHTAMGIIETHDSARGTTRTNEEGTRDRQDAVSERCTRIDRTAQPFTRNERPTRISVRTRRVGDQGRGRDDDGRVTDEDVRKEDLAAPPAPSKTGRTDGPARRGARVGRPVRPHRGHEHLDKHKGGEPGAT